MSNNKQTAVEWLVGKLTVQNEDGEVVNAYPDWIDLTEFIEQAKEMEKQQIMDAWDDGNDNEIRGGKYRRIIREKYYNEEYGKQ